MNKIDSSINRSKPYTPNSIKAFYILRFPLIVGVVYLHNIGADADKLPIVCDLSFSNISIYDIYNIARLLLSWVLPLIAVPCFFFMSGYLFYYKTDDFNFEVFKEKVRKRIKTLAIPYFSWNTVTLMLLLVWSLSLSLYKGTTMEFKGMIWLFKCFINVGGGVSNEVNWLGFPYYHSYPIDDPLWFLRDLILLSIISPVIFYLIKKVGGAFLVLTFAPLLLQILPYTPREDLKALFFFSFGAYWGIKKIDFFAEFNKIKQQALFASFASACLSLYYYKNEFHIDYVFQSIYILFGVITAMNYVRCISWVDNNISKLFCTLSGTTFFVYALHRVFIFNNIWSFGADSTNSVGTQFLVYMLSPILKVICCLLIYFFMSKKVPRLLKLLTGGR